MQNNIDIKDTVGIATFSLFVMSLISFGIYLVYWVGKATAVLNAGNKIKPISEVLVGFLCVVLGAGALVTYSETDPAMQIIYLLFSLVCSGLYIWWAYQARTALIAYAAEHYGIELKMNRFYTFIFNVYYICYCVNCLPVAKSSNQSA